MKAVYCFGLMISYGASASPDPQITSWFTLNSGNPARIYRSDAERLSGEAEVTWSNGRQSQLQPAFSGVQEIVSSSNWVYIKSTGLGSHVMGPWLNGAFPNLPTDQHFIFAIPRHPSVQRTAEFNPLGEIGMFVDGVRMFDANDAFSYSHANGRDADPRAGIGRGDSVWNRDAFVNEGNTFDAALGHQQNWGRYHYHAEPLALRYLLGDHVDVDSGSKTYHESSGPVTRHSPILGWMHDGYPIYGPYGYSAPREAGSGIRRMVSGFVLRNGQNGTDNLALTARHRLPAWEVREEHRTAVLQESEYGPKVNARYPLGRYIEDYAYLGDAGKVQGKDFDLDETNGRWCVTPEFPNGTYAYFTTIDGEGKPAYPYNMGRRYHGSPVGRLVRGIYEPVTTNFVAHPASTVTNVPSGTAALIYNADQSGYQAR